MNLILPTQPDFLRQRFSQVRSYLKGAKEGKTEVFVDHQGARASQVTLFASGEQKSWLAEQGISKKILGLGLTAVTAISILLGTALFIPTVYYTFFPADVIEVSAPEPGTAFGGDFEAGTADDTTNEADPTSPLGQETAGAQADAEPEEEVYQPPVDPSLPEGDWLIIPRIGVRSQLRDTEDPEEALAKGIWWVPDFGKPGDKELPMIAAAHRYGWKWWWQDDYWKYHSFHLLPDTEPGDRIEVISNQQKWQYEIYAGQEGDKITDYNADLILYTCKFLTGPVRHFRYARLIDPTTDTQATQLNQL